MTFRIMTPSLLSMCCYAECRMRSVMYVVIKKALYAEYHYSECRYAECHYAECRYA